MELQANQVERAEINTILNSRMRDVMQMGGDAAEAFESAIALVRSIVDDWAQDHYDDWNDGMQSRHEDHLDMLELERDCAENFAT